MYRTLLLFVAIAVAFGSFTSCTSAKKLEEKLNQDVYYLEYRSIPDTTITKTGVKVNIDSVTINPGALNSSTQITKKKGPFIPLVLVYIWNRKYTCTLGKRMIGQEIPDFTRMALKSEIEKRGNFDVSNGGVAEYQLILNVEQLKTEGLYRTNGFFYFFLFYYGWAKWDIAGPSITTLNLSYTLLKGKEVITSGVVPIQKIYDPKPPKKRMTSKEYIHAELAQLMVKSTSNALNLAVEEVVKKVNASLVEK